MQRTKGPGDTLKRFKNRIWRIRAREYRQYHRAVRRAVDQAVEGLGLGEKIGARALQAILEEEIGDPELRRHLRPLNHVFTEEPTLPHREAIARGVEEVLSERSYMELREVWRKIREQELQEKRERRWKVTSQSGELHFLFVEGGSWDPEFFHEPSEGETIRIIERLGLNPHNTLICTVARQGRGRVPLLISHGEGGEYGLSSPGDDIKRYRKKGTWLKLYLHDVRRVPKENASLSTRPIGLRELYEDQHLSACLGEAKFGAKSFPWYLGRHALSKHLNFWIRECRRELRERGQLTEAEAQQILTGLNKRHEEAKRRSLELLRKTVGKKETDAFLKLGYLIVKSANGEVYRITRDGEVIDTSTGHSVCVEVDADDELPVYDEVLAKYLVIRDHPEQIETLERGFGWDELVPASTYVQIWARTGMSEDEVAERIEQKRAELAYQVTALGAALLVAQELRVNLGERGTQPRASRSQDRKGKK